MVFFHFLYRDFYVHSKHFTDHLVNYGLIYPVLFTFCFAIMQTAIYFHGQELLGATIFAGTCLTPLLVMTFHLSFELLFDLEQNQYTNYQITLLNPSLLIIEQIIFCSLFTFFVLIPYYPIGCLLSYPFINLQYISWPSVFLMLYLGCLCCASYNKCAVMFLRIKTLTSFWARINHPMQAFGGFWIPFIAIQSFSPMLGYLVRLNPLMYLTEGMRQSMIGGPEFLPFWQCSLTLFFMSIFFTALSCYFFKQRIDHI